jgi:hypothetical protein
MRMFFDNSGCLVLLYKLLGKILWRRILLVLPWTLFGFIPVEDMSIHVAMGIP